jgi:hypothetical protein
MELRLLGEQNFAFLLNPARIVPIREWGFGTDLTVPGPLKTQPMS